MSLGTATINLDEGRSGGKTGTSTLQVQLFAKHSEIAFLGLFGHLYKDERLQRLADAVRRAPPAEYDSALCQHREREPDARPSATALSDASSQLSARSRASM